MNCLPQPFAAAEDDRSDLQQLGQKASDAFNKAAGSVKDAFEVIDDNVLEYCSLDAKVPILSVTTYPVHCLLLTIIQFGFNMAIYDMQGARRMSKMTLGEKEAEFLEALRVKMCFQSLQRLCAADAVVVNILFVQSFYFEDKPAMSNEEFDNLKEELLWEGSRVAVLR